MKVNVVNEGIKWGCINGLIAVLIMYGSWAAGINTFVSVSFWANFCPYMIVILIIAGIQLKKQNEGLLPFSQALKFTFLSYVIVAVIGALGTYILYNLIDKDLTMKSVEAGIAKTQSMMEKFGAKEEDIEKTIKSMREEGTKGTGLG